MGVGGDMWVIGWAMVSGGGDKKSFLRTKIRFIFGLLLLFHKD